MSKAILAITLWVSLKKHQTITFIMKVSYWSPLLLTDFISSQWLVLMSTQEFAQSPGKNISNIAEKPPQPDGFTYKPASRT
jgi:hypothetical protein